MTESDETPPKSLESGDESQPNPSDTLPVVTGRQTETKTATGHEYTARLDAEYAAPSWLPLDADEKVLWQGHPCWRSVVTTSEFLAGMTLIALAIVLIGSNLVSSSVTLATPAIHTSVLGWQLDIAAVGTTIPVVWIALGLAILAGGLCLSALRRPLFSKHVLTSDAVYLNTSIRSHDYRKIGLDRVCDIDIHRHLLSGIFGHGDCVLGLTGTTISAITLHGIETPHVLSQLLCDLEVDPDSPVDLRPEYIQVSPARDAPDPHEVVEELGSLHSVFSLETRLRDRLFGTANRQPSITFTEYSQGENQPVEFYYSADTHLDEVEQRLRKAYPNSFDVQRVKRDFNSLAVPPRAYSPIEFKAALSNDAVQCSPGEVAALHSSMGYTQSSSPSQSSDQSQSPSSSHSGSESSEVHADGGAVGYPSSLNIDPTASSLVLSLPKVDLDIETDLDSTLLRHNGSLSASERVDLQAIDTPVMTPEGNILARPAASETSPLGIEWTEDGDRMMPLEPYSEVVTSRDDHAPAAHPLSTVVDELATAEHPSVLHVAVEAEDDWSDAAADRQEQLRQGNDTNGRLSTGARVLQTLLMGLIETLLWFIAGIFEAFLGKQVDEGEHNRNENQFQQQDTYTPQEDGIDANSEEIDKITQKQPSRTYRMNVAFTSVPATDGDPESDPATTAPRLDNRLETLTSVFDRVSNGDYWLSGSRIRSGYRKTTKTKRARRVLTRILDQRLRPQSSGGWIRNRGQNHIRVNSEGLANFMSVPGANSLTATGVRGTRSEQDSRKSLSPPHNKHLERFHDTRGMDIGHIVDDDSDSYEEIASLSPEVLTSHVARLVSTDGGKTIALINDGLSLYENTDGPVIIVDTRGGNLANNYMRCHAAKFGVEDFKENVLHFQIPDIMPGFSFFDIRSAIADGRSRTEAVADNGENYQEVVKLAMGDKYDNANVAPILIPSLIKTLYDTEYGYENGRYRESLDYFSHDQFEYAIDQLMQAGPPDPDPTQAPQSSKRNVTRVIRRQLERDERSFQTVMGGVGTRTHYISGDDRLLPMFNNTTSKFEFKNILDENKVILLDLSNLRKDSARVVSGVLLTQLFDSLRDNQEMVAEKPPEYLVNLLVDEAASVMGSDTMNTMLEEGRKFRLSLDLATQFPEQFKYEANKQAYLNVLNNVATPIVGQITVDEKMAEALAYEKMDNGEVKNRVKSLPRGEFMVRTRSKGWGEDHPTPYSLRPMPIPVGHPEGDAPLTDKGEQQFQDALAAVDERTQSEYGIEEGNAPPDYFTPGELRGYLGIEDAEFDTVIAETVRTVQLHDGVAESNDRVALETVKEELKRLFGAVDGLDADEDGPSAETLSAIEERSHLLDLEIADGFDLDTWPDAYGASVRAALDEELSKPDGGSREVMSVKLTEAGIDRTALDLGHVEAAGSEEHIGLLEQIQQALSEAGFSVRLVPQDGRDLPDARAFHSELDENYHIEAEHTTPDVPIKVFDNLWKAQDAGCTPIFAVETDPEEPTYWARRLERVLTPPIKREHEDDTVEYYTYDEEIELAGDTTAVRPVAGPDESRYSLWESAPGNRYVLRDGNGTEHARVTDFDGLSKQDFPGHAWYDPDSNQFLVFASGTEYAYESREAFKTDWVTIRQPFVPEEELIEPEYTREDYEIVMLPLEGDDEGETDELDRITTPEADADNEPVVYRDETLYPLSVLVEGIPDNREPASTVEQNASSPTSNTEQSRSDDSAQSSIEAKPDEDSTMANDSEDPLDRFFEKCVTETCDEVADNTWIDADGDLFVPKDVLQDAVNIWMDSHTDREQPEITKIALTRNIFPEYFDDILAKRRSIDGEQIPSYIGISLTETGKELINDI